MERGNEKKSLLVVSFTKIASDVRINRHIQHLSQEFEIMSVGYGRQPENVKKHLEIPQSLKYLPLSPVGIFRLLFNLMGNHGPKSQALKFVSSQITVLNPAVVLINDVQCLPLIDVLDTQVIKVLDMHEYAPLEMEDDWRFRILLKRYYTYLCARYMKQADAVITVSDGLAQRYSVEFEIPVQVVMNARDYVEKTREPVASDVLRLVHTGLAARGRHLERMIHAVGVLPDVSLTLYLVQAPRQSRTLKSLKKLTAKYENCSVNPPVPSSELPSLISNFDAGLLFIAPSNFSLRHCLPNKLFDCIQARRPVIVGPSPDMADFVKKHDVGFVSPTFDVDDLRKTIMGISRADLDRRSESLERTAVSINEESEGIKLRDILLSAMK